MPSTASIDNMPSTAGIELDGDQAEARHASAATLRQIHCRPHTFLAIASVLCTEEGFVDDIFLSTIGGEFVQGISQDLNHAERH